MSYPSPPPPPPPQPPQPPGSYDSPLPPAYEQPPPPPPPVAQAPPPPPKVIAAPESASPPPPKVVADKSSAVSEKGPNIVIGKAPHPSGKDAGKMKSKDYFKKAAAPKKPLPVWALWTIVVGVIALVAGGIAIGVWLANRTSAENNSGNDSGTNLPQAVCDNNVCPLQNDDTTCYVRQFIGNDLPEATIALSSNALALYIAGVIPDGPQDGDIIPLAGERAEFKLVSYEMTGEEAAETINVLAPTSEEDARRFVAVLERPFRDPNPSVPPVYKTILTITKGIEVNNNDAILCSPPDLPCVEGLQLTFIPQISTTGAGINNGLNLFPNFCENARALDE
nr:hypothetical protein [Sicyoidochytrium minutum DNA virus]